MINTPGPCEWNGNEIVMAAEPNRGVAGVAPDAPDEWGSLFASAPEMYEALVAAREQLVKYLRTVVFGSLHPDVAEQAIARNEVVAKIDHALAKARGEQV